MKVRVGEGADGNGDLGVVRHRSLLAGWLARWRVET